MSKEVTCKVIKKYCSTDETEYGDTQLVELSWNNRPCTGVDIRKHDSSKDMYLKGITVSYEGLNDIVCSAIENGLVKIDDVESSVKKRKSKMYTASDFDKLFAKMRKEDKKYTRDNLGRLRDGEYVVITRKNK